MPSFDAKKAVEPLEYDFAPYADAKGTVPEPTDDQVAEFYGALAHRLTDALGEETFEGVDMEDAYEVGKVFMSLDADANRKLYDRLVEIHANVCNQKPSADEIAALPYRLKRVWFGMIQGWLRPEASTPAMSD